MQLWVSCSFLSSPNTVPKIVFSFLRKGIILRIDDDNTTICAHISLVGIFFLDFYYFLLISSSAFLTRCITSFFVLHWKILLSFSRSPFLSIIFSIFNLSINIISIPIFSNSISFFYNIFIHSSYKFIHFTNHHSQHIRYSLHSNTSLLIFFSQLKWRLQTSLCILPLLPFLCWSLHCPWRGKMWNGRAFSGPHLLFGLKTQWPDVRR